ncbi:hypothetical protein BHYA_0080g00190 [Botrytis hyacinthi]|uniref:Uncharacterized protein n=1 Tax=Botrytis hyacinthi TaxID=278943 RepID=A0A4Z1GTI9_9HELO|nr:hypothetical protein BHYA_0080g00190 [Botrytis hyacinthi]
MSMSTAYYSQEPRNQDINQKSVLQFKVLRRVLFLAKVTKPKYHHHYYYSSSSNMAYTPRHLTD